LWSDLFEVAAMPVVSSASARLPRHITPGEDEALVSWVARMSLALDQSPLMLGRIAFGVDAAADPEWWRRPSDATLGLICERTGLDRSRLEATTLRGWAMARDDEDAERFTSRRWMTPKPSRRRGRRVDICRQCVADDSRPYLRRLWLLGWAGACPRHRTLLSGQCPSCWQPIKLKGLNVSSPVDLLACQRCGARLAGPAAQPAHPLVLDLQDMLIAGKRTDALDPAGVGRINWATMMAVTDMLLGMIWADIATQHRERLFDRVSRDLALGAGDRVALSVTSNYGGLLMLGWLLEDLPHRLRAAIAILKSVRFDGLLGRLEDVDDEVAARLRVILAPAIATRPTIKGAWRAWIDGLPESAADLRRRADVERYKHRRQRLTAFAELRAGATVVAAAEVVGVRPKSLYAWLDRGAEQGLEAALERPTGKPALTSRQAEMLAKWIAADTRNQLNRAVVEQAMSGFGVVLSTNAATKLIAKHGRPKFGGRRRLWKPKPCVTGG
jgi:transposase